MKRPGVRLSWSEVTNPGARPGNQDRIGAARHAQLACFVVADGAGGHAGGETAATLVRDEVLAAFLESPAATPTAAARCIDKAIARVAAVKAADGAVNGKLADMSSTAAVLLVDQDGAAACWAHLGDSRIYLFRAGALLHASADHSFVQQLIEGGYADAGAARSHPQRHVLLAAIGAENGLAASVSDCADLLPGDALLVCSDGLWEWVDETAMLAALATSARAEDWLAALCARAAQAASGTYGVERDNFSAYAIRVHAQENAA